jgi:hypothetical protein
VEGVAAADAGEAFVDPFDAAVFLDGFDHIGAATGIEAAVFSHQRAEEVLIESDEADDP